jgi:hypothetical protein
MCNDILFKGTVISTPRQLARLVGGSEMLVWLEQEGEMDWCLCVVDLPATLERARLRWRLDRDSATFIVEC